MVAANFDDTKKGVCLSTVTTALAAITDSNKVQEVIHTAGALFVARENAKCVFTTQPTRTEMGVANTATNCKTLPKEKDCTDCKDDVRVKLAKVAGGAARCVTGCTEEQLADQRAQDAAAAAAAGGDAGADAMTTCMATATTLAAVRQCKQTAGAAIAAATGTTECTTNQADACKADAAALLGCGCATQSSIEHAVKQAAVKNVGEFTKNCDQSTPTLITTCNAGAKALYLKEAGILASELTDTEWTLVQKHAAQIVTADFMLPCMEAANKLTTGATAQTAARKKCVTDVEVVVDKVRTSGKTRTAEDKRQDQKNAAIAALSDANKQCLSTTGADLTANAKQQCLGDTAMTTIAAALGVATTDVSATDLNLYLQDAQTAGVETRVVACVNAATTTGGAANVIATAKKACLIAPVAAALAEQTGEVASDITPEAINKAVEGARRKNIVEGVRACIASLATDDSAARMGCRTSVGQEAYNTMSGLPTTDAVKPTVLAAEFSAAAKPIVSDALALCAKATEDAAAKRTCKFVTAKAALGSATGKPDADITASELNTVVEEAGSKKLAETTKACMKATTGAAGRTACRTAQKAALADAIGMVSSTVEPEVVKRFVAAAAVDAVQVANKDCMEAANELTTIPAITAAKVKCFTASKTAAANAKGAGSGGVRGPDVFSAVQHQVSRDEAAIATFADLAKDCHDAGDAGASDCAPSTLLASVVAAAKNSYGSTSTGADALPADTSTAKGKAVAQRLVAKAETTIFKKALYACKGENANGLKPTVAEVKACISTAAVAAGYDKLAALATGKPAGAGPKRKKLALARAVGSAVCEYMADCAESPESSGNIDTCKTKVITFAKTFESDTTVTKAWLGKTLQRCRAKMLRDAKKCDSPADCATALASTDDVAGPAASALINLGGKRAFVKVDEKLGAIDAAVEAHAACKDAQESDAKCEPVTRAAFTEAGGNPDATKYADLYKAQIEEVAKKVRDGDFVEPTKKMTVDFTVTHTGACAPTRDSEIQTLVTTACAGSDSKCVVEPIESVEESSTSSCTYWYKLKNICTDDAECETKATEMSTKTITTARRRRLLATTTTTSAQTTDYSTASGDTPPGATASSATSRTAATAGIAFAALAATLLA